MRTVTPVLYRRKSTEKHGIIKIRITENRKNTYISLSERISVKYWNENTNRVRENKDIDYVRINGLIEKKLEELQQSIKVFKTDDTLSFLDYYSSVINRISNEGSKIKQVTVKNKLVKYLATKHKTDLLYTEITEDFLFDLKKYFEDGMKKETSNHYLKIIKGVLNKAVEENKYNYLRNPFLSLKFTSSKEKKVKSLSEKEVGKLIALALKDSRVEKYWQAFMFQLFAQGMRVSDVQLIRWNNFENNILHYVMLKTGQDMYVYINDNLLGILQPIMKERLTDVSRASTLNGLELELTEAEQKLRNRLKYVYEVEMSLDLIPEGFFEGDEIGKEMVSDMRIAKERLKLFYRSLLNNFFSVDKDLKGRFVFDFLKDSDFENIKMDNDFSKMTPKQYRKLKNNSIVYNRNLKTLQELAKIRTKLTTHVARHTYTSLLMNSDNVNLYEISKSLGHSDVTITQNYISRFDTARLDKLNKSIAEKYKMM